jgi:hypothetical protein
MTGILFFVAEGMFIFALTSTQNLEPSLRLVMAAHSSVKNGHSMKQASHLDLA